MRESQVRRTGMRTVDEALAVTADVVGWMTDGQGRRLYAAGARARPNGQIVEIGSFRGRSTIVLASAVPPDVHVIAIDPHAGNDRGPREIDGYAAEAASDHEVFTANLAAAGVTDRVRHVRAFSDAAHGQVEGEIDVLYIDGAHRYAPARADIAQWGRRVPVVGTMLIHDSFSSIGVTAAILRHLAWNAEFTYVRRTSSLAEYRRSAPVGRARLRSTLRQFAQLPWFARNVLVKVAIVLRLRSGEWPY